MARAVFVQNSNSLTFLELSLLLDVSRDSSKESQRRPWVPDRIQLCCSQYKSAKSLYKFLSFSLALKYSIFLMSPERPSRSLIELLLFQTGVSSIVQNSIVLAIYLRQVSYLVSRTSSKKSKRMSLVPDVD